MCPEMKDTVSIGNKDGEKVKDQKCLFSHIYMNFMRHGKRPAQTRKLDSHIHCSMSKILF